MNKILFIINEKFIEQEKINTLYLDKIEWFNNNNSFIVKNIFDISDIKLNSFDVVLFNSDTVYLFKKYFKREKLKAETNFNKLLSIKNKFIILENTHVKTYRPIDDFCNILNENQTTVHSSYPPSPGLLNV